MPKPAAKPKLSAADHKKIASHVTKAVKASLAAKPKRRAASRAAYNPYFTYRRPPGAAIPLHY